ncbi:MAG: hypothetical protein HQL52_04465 [Magnetococcales bacterium]|nr:hypothetical protein [Magnetococcales bacterium]
MASAPGPSLPPGKDFRSQQGVALLMLMIIMTMAGTALVLHTLPTESLRWNRNKVSLEVLKKVKEALIIYAATNDTRPGELPCPDLDFDQDADGPGYGDNNGSVCATDTGPTLYVGRLPWEDLGLNERDVKDVQGEVVWYALAMEFSLSEPTINSSTEADDMGEDIVAVIFSPGAGVAELDQFRVTDDDLLDWSNYLEYISVGDTIEGAVTYPLEAEEEFNDLWLTISRDEILTAVEKRVLKSAKVCLAQFAADNSGKYPWAAPVANGDNNGVCGTYFGRLPLDTLNVDDVADCAAATPDSPAMDSGWATRSECTDLLSGGWIHDNAWQDLLFFQLTAGFDPGTAVTGCGMNCLKINSGSTDYQAVVILAGEELDDTSPEQDRSVLGATIVIENYLEDNNLTASTTLNFDFTKIFTDTFNDRVACLDGTDDATEAEFCPGE